MVVLLNGFFQLLEKGVWGRHKAGLELILMRTTFGCFYKLVVLLKVFFGFSKRGLGVDKAGFQLISMRTILAVSMNWLFFSRFVFRLLEKGFGVDRAGFQLISMRTIFVCFYKLGVLSKVF